MEIKIIDLTDYSLLPFDGYSSFDITDCQRVLKGVPKNLRKDYFIEMDKRPSWWFGSAVWRQTWTIRKKMLKGVCV